MPIQFKCDACGASYQKGDEFAGQTARCRCGATLQIPMVATLDYNDLQSAAANSQENAPIEVGPEHLASANMGTVNQPPQSAPQQNPVQQNPQPYASAPQQLPYGQAAPYQGQPQSGGYPQQQAWPGTQQAHQAPTKSRMSMDSLRLLILCAVGLLVVGGVAVFTLWPDDTPAAVEVAELQPGALLVLWVEPDSVEIPPVQRADLASLSESFSVQVKNAMTMEFSDSNIPTERWHLQLHTPRGLAVVEQAHKDFSFRLRNDRLTPAQIDALNAAWDRFKSRGDDPQLQAALAQDFGWAPQSNLAQSMPPANDPGPSDGLAQGESVGQTGSPTQTGPDANQEPAFKLSAEEFFAAYRDDEDAFAEKFGGKSIQLEGTVRDFSRTAGADSQIDLRGGDGSSDFVFCSTLDELPWAKVSHGQRVRITGVQPGYPYPSLHECRFEALEPNPAPTVTAKKLASDYSDLEVDTDAIYAHKHFYLTGKVVQYVHDKEKVQRYVELEGANGVRIQCFMKLSGVPDDWTPNAPVGSTVTFYVTVGLYGNVEGIVRPSPSLPVKGIEIW